MAKKKKAAKKKAAKKKAAKKKAAKKKAAKKKAAKKSKLRMLSPIWLDEEDQAAMGRLQEEMWARTKQDAILHSLRWACRHIEKSPNAYRRHMRESNRAFADGRALILRFTEEQREHLEAFAESIHADSITDAVRILIRMSKAFFVKD